MFISRTKRTTCIGNYRQELASFSICTGLKLLKITLAKQRCVCCGSSGALIDSHKLKHTTLTEQ
jgi:hypothetical protein